jgi:2-hydroxychromene-2-carboxylate isomerase
MAEVEMFFDCSSPWTYFAFHSLRELQKEIGVTVAWRPHLVGGVFNAVNPSVHNSREKPVVPKANYGKKDQLDWARFLGLRCMYRPSVFPVNSVRIMRACCALEGTDAIVPFAAAGFDAYWGDDRDISQPAVIESICRKAGVDPAQVMAAIETQPIKDRLRNNTQELIDRGGFGSPTIYVGDDDMYFGNDRMPLIRDAVLRRRAA